GAAEEEVVAALAQQGVVAGLAEEHVPTRAAGQSVVPGATKEVRGWQRPAGFIEGDRIVAALAEHLDERYVGDGRRSAQDGDRAVVDEHGAGGVAADRYRVVQRVAEDGQNARAGRERGRHRRGEPGFQGVNVGYKMGLPGTAPRGTALVTTKHRLQERAQYQH